MLIDLDWSDVPGVVEKVNVPGGRFVRVRIKNFAQGPMRLVSVSIPWPSGRPREVAGEGWFTTIAESKVSIWMAHLEPSPEHWVLSIVDEIETEHRADPLSGVCVNWIDRWGNVCEGAPGEPSRVVTYSKTPYTLRAATDTA